MDATIVNVTAGRIVGGSVIGDTDYTNDAIYTNDYTTGMNPAGDTASFVVFDTKSLSPFVVAALRSGNASFVVNFTTSTGATIERTLHVYAGSETADIKAQIARSNNVDAARSSLRQNQAQIETIAVRKGVAPFTSDENQNQTQSVDITQQVLTAIEAGKNAMLWFDVGGPWAAGNVNITGMSVSLGGLVFAPSIYASGKPAIVTTSAASSPFSTGTLTSTLPSDYIHDDNVVSIPVDSGNNSATSLIDSSKAVIGTSYYLIVQSDGAAGTLSGAGLSVSNTYVKPGMAGYLLVGTPDTITAALQALVFTPSTASAVQGETVTFSLSELQSLPNAPGGAPVPLAGSIATIVIGQDNGRMLTGGLDEIVARGGRASGTIVSAVARVDRVFDDENPSIQSQLKVTAGGAAFGTMLQGGLLNVGAGGASSDTIISSTVVTYSHYHYTPDGTLLGAGGVQGTVGGQETIEANGLSSGAHVLSGGTQSVSGRATGTMVGAGGLQTVLQGGLAQVTTVSADGRLVVMSGGTVTGLRISGGTAVLQSGAVASGTITFTGGGTLELHNAPGSGTTKFGSTISGFSAGARIDFTGLSYDAGSKATLANGVLTVTTGASSETFTLLDSTASAVSLESDGAGGVLVSAPSAPTVTGSFNQVLAASSNVVRPFRDAVVADPNAGATETVAIQLSEGGAGGSLSGTGLSGGANGLYALSGTAAAVTQALSGLVFTPATGQPNSRVTTTFTVTDTTSLGTSASNAGFAVTIATKAANPSILGQASLASVSEAPTAPFAAATVVDPNANSRVVLTIRQFGGGGTLAGAGLTPVDSRSATLSGTADQVTAALRQLVFTPTAGQPNTSAATSFEMTVNTTPGTSVRQTSFSVTNTDPAVAPVLRGAGSIAVSSEAVSTPFATATLADANANSTDMLTIQLSAGGAGGVLSGTGLSDGGGGTYVLNGTAAAVTAALQALVFTPAKGAAGTSTTTALTLSAVSSAGPATSIGGFSVVNTDPVIPILATTAVFNPGTVNDAVIAASGIGSRTIIVGSGSRNTVLMGTSSGTVTGTGSGGTVTAGNGTISISGLGGGTSVMLGDGNNTVNLAASGAGNVIVAGNGNNRIAAGNGGKERVTVGGGTNVISAGGANDVISTGNGANTITATGAAAVVTTGSGNDSITITGAGGATIHAGLGTNRISFAGTGNRILNDGGTDMLFDTGSGNTIVLAAGPQGLTTVGANALTNGDVFDLRAALAATAWNHQAGTLGAFLTVGTQGGDATLSITPSGTPGGAASTVAVITGAGGITLDGFLSHALT